MALIFNKAFRPMRIKRFNKRMVKKHEQVVDSYDEQLRELCAIRNPELRTNQKLLREKQTEFIFEHLGKRKSEECGTWFFFPWLGTYVHYLESSLHEELRTARNKNLITSEEQSSFRNFPIAVAGLSVGSHAALSIVLQGGGSDLRLADPDIISGSNLNRIRTGFQSVGLKKTTVVAREIYTMNPYTKLRLLSKELSEKNIDHFLQHPVPVDVVVDEIDNLPMKFLIRERARALRIPVVSATDNGDGILLDVERYDQEPDAELFLGRAHGLSARDCFGLSPQETVQIIVQLLDAKRISKRMMKSAQDVGKTLYSWPQLGGAATVAGAAVAYAVRMIATGGPLPSGRTVLSFESLISKRFLL